MADKAEDGTITGFRGLFRDITARVAAEAEKRRLEAQLQQAQKMEALGTLAGGVAHDLNNILSGLVTYPEVLIETLTPDSQVRKGLETIRRSGKKATTIVQDLLTLARREVAVSEILNLNHIVRDYLDSPECASLLHHHGNVTIDPDLAPDLLNLSGSAVHLSKTVMNLVSNAAEAMPTGGAIRINTRNVRVDAPDTAHPKRVPGEYVAIGIADSGIGISEEDRQRIFEPFYTKKVMGRSGTGLGMAVVWGTVQDHKGHIDLVSEPGRGTSVTLYFPAQRAEATARPQAPPMQAYRGRGETIVAVDDQPLQRELLDKILGRLGYAVTVLASGEEAVAYMESHSADLLILDMIMDPGIDGFETYRRILEQHPGQKAILCSGFSESERVRQARALGAGTYLRKPYALDELGRAVRAATISSSVVRCVTGPIHSKKGDARLP